MMAVIVDMYEQAAILTYQNKKIWIKEVIKRIYFVNGCLLGFSKKRDVDSIENIVRLLDSYYTSDTKDDLNRYGDYFLLLDVGDSLLPLYCCSLIFLDGHSCSILEADVDVMRREYTVWLDTIDEEDLYLNYYR